MLINQIPADTVENVKSEEEFETVNIEYWKNQNEALERLYDNEDFKTVILHGYFKDKAVRGVSMLGTNYTRTNGVRPALMEELVGISALEEHFNVIRQMGGVTGGIFEEDAEGSEA